MKGRVDAVCKKRSTMCAEDNVMTMGIALVDRSVRAFSADLNAEGVILMTRRLSLKEVTLCR
jgi:hypothetical protein